MVDLRVLGPVRAHADGRECALGGAKQRALLARLTVAHGRPLSAERLIDDLWGESLPRDPEHALQTRMSRLRSVVPVDIELRSGGYRLDPTKMQVDSVHFERLCEHAGWLIADGDLPRAAQCLNDALALWQGPAFHEMSNIPALHTEAMRLEKLRDSAIADQIDVDLALGNHAAIVPQLNALVEENPLFERHWGQLMIALYRDDRVDEALAAYDRAREVLDLYLGVEPSGELGTLRGAIIHRQPSESLLRWPPPDSTDGTSLDGESGVAPEVSVVSNQSSSLAALVRDRRTLILTGPAGIGKTHLLRAIRATLEARRCSAPLVSASPLSRATPLGVFAGLGGVSGEARDSPVALIDFFARHRSMTVLLVDNVEELDEASLFVVTHLIRTSRVPAILTSRDLTNAPPEIRALYDSGELTEVEVRGLSDDDAGEVINQTLGGPVTPTTLPRLLASAGGNPLHLREVISGSVDEGRLVQTSHGWELRGPPAATPRLAQLVGERFSGLDDACLDAAAVVAIAGECPAEAIGRAQRRALARAGVLAVADNGWIRLAHPLDVEFLQSRSSAVEWRELTREAATVLQAEGASARPGARRRAGILALDLADPVDVESTLALGEHALGAFDERLALRAAEAVLAHAPRDVRAHRIAGVAASSLGENDVAVAHFETAQQASTTTAERTAVALAHAEHLGLRHHDATAALAVLEEALPAVDDADDVAHLNRASLRWATVAGYGGTTVSEPDETSDPVAALGLITVGMSAVITGPLDDASRVVTRLRQVPDEVMEMVPGGASLIDLIAIMELSNSGDVVATRRRLRDAIDEAATESPEALGMYGYALGFGELLSGDANQAYSWGQSAATHLEWRDTAGLLPAAKALAGAAAQATGRSVEADKLFDAVPDAAAGDPKIVMLKAWADARHAHAERRRDDSVRILIEAARWMFDAQHTYFAGMLAHCVVRVGADLADAVAVIDEANRIAGGGLLDLFARHAKATVDDDPLALEVIAREAAALGMASTAADTWLAVARTSPEAARPHAAAEQLRAEFPAIVLWGDRLDG